MKKKNRLHQLSESSYILFVARVVSAARLPFSDSDFLDWLNFACEHRCDENGEKLGMFTLWQSFLVSRSMDLCQDCWNGNCDGNCDEN